MTTAISVPSGVSQRSLPQVAENATICSRHGYDGVPAGEAFVAHDLSENRIPLFGIMP
jgi:hypothetical protein